MKKIKLYLVKIITPIKSMFSKDKLEGIIESLAITNFSINKGSYFLFWFIAVFFILDVVSSVVICPTLFLAASTIFK